MIPFYQPGPQISGVATIESRNIGPVFLREEVAIIKHFDVITTYLEHWQLKLLQQLMKRKKTNTFLSKYFSINALIRLN